MESTETLTSMVGRVATAMENAVIEYGPDAVDLAMLAYQVDAIRYLMGGGLGLCATFALALAYKKVWMWAYDWGQNDTSIDIVSVRGTGFVITLLLSIIPVMISTRLISPVHWIAALGNPELLIATQALRAAGLL